MSLLDRFTKGSRSCVVMSSLNHAKILVDQKVLSQNTLDNMTCYATELATLTETEEVRSIWLDFSKEKYDTVILAHTLPVFRGNFWNEFIRSLFEMVNPGGVLIVPLGDGTRHERSIENYEALIGMTCLMARTKTSRPYAIFDKSRSEGELPTSTTESLLEWYQDGNMDIIFDVERQNAAYLTFHGLTLEEMRNTVPHYNEFLTAFKVSESVNRITEGQNLTLEAYENGTYNFVTDRPAKALLADVNAQSYSIGCLRYKAPIISHIISQFMGSKPNLHLTDLGGGYGTLATEILLDDINNVTDITVNDPSVRYMIFANYMYTAMRERLNGHYSFALGLMETFDFQPSDIISMIGSFLFVDREKRMDFIAEAFENLNPGGLLIIHENIRADSYKAVKEHGYMLEAKELDSYLSPHGEIRYFSSTYWAEIPAEDVKNNTVFRVVQKS